MKRKAVIIRILYLLLVFELGALATMLVMTRITKRQMDQLGATHDWFDGKHYGINKVDKSLTYLELIRSGKTNEVIIELEKDLSQGLHYIATHPEHYRSFSEPIRGNATSLLERARNHNDMHPITNTCKFKHVEQLLKQANENPTTKSTLSSEGAPSDER